MTLVAIYTRVEERARAGVWPNFFASLYFGFLLFMPNQIVCYLYSLVGYYLASHPRMCTILLVFGIFF